jgi:hypothetical protein
MRLISSRVAIAIAVTVATATVCFLGIRAELRAAKAPAALVAGDDKPSTDSTPP